MKEDVRWEAKYVSHTHTPPAHLEITFEWSNRSIDSLIREFWEFIQAIQKCRDIDRKLFNLFREILRIQTLINNGLQDMRCRGVFVLWSALFYGIRIDEREFPGLPAHFAREEICCVFSEQEENLGKAVAEVKGSWEDSYWTA